MATDVNGLYELSIQKNLAGTLVFSFVGMKAQEIAINGRTEINVKMESEVAEKQGPDLSKKEIVLAGEIRYTKATTQGAKKKTPRKGGEGDFMFSFDFEDKIRFTKAVLQLQADPASEAI